MKHDVSLKLLEEQKKTLRTTPKFEIWLEQTLKLVEEIFGRMSSQYSELHSIHCNFRNSDKLESNFVTFKNSSNKCLADMIIF